MRIMVSDSSSDVLHSRSINCPCRESGMKKSDYARPRGDRGWILQDDHYLTHSSERRRTLWNDEYGPCQMIIVQIPLLVQVIIHGLLRSAQGQRQLLCVVCEFTSSMWIRLMLIRISGSRARQSLSDRSNFSLTNVIT
jgi:hypothetical protein